MALEPAGVQLVAQDANQFFGDMDRASRAVNSFSDTTEKAGGRVGAFGEIAIGALRKVGEFGVEMLAQAGKALVDFGIDSIGVAGDFEAGMNRFEAAAGDLDTAGLEEFRGLFLDIGKELPVSTGDVQDAAIELVKGGLDPAILSAGGLKDAIQFAAAAELDLADAAVIAVKQLGVWTDATATAEEQTAFLAMSQDLLVKAAGASTVNVDKLTAAMNNAGGQARALNLDYQDFVTGLTLVSPAFGSAEQAGTSYNVFLKQLQPTTDPAIAAMQDLGLWTEEAGSAFFDANGEFIGNREAAELLKQATEGLTDAEKALALQTIFGVDGMVTANTLAEQGAEGYDILAEKIENASGVQATAALKQAGYNTALDNAKGSLEAMQITIGSKLLPVLTTFLNDYISPGINAITEFADVIFAAGGPVESLAGYFQAVVEDGDTLNDFLSHLPEPLQDIAYAIGEVIAFGQDVIAFFQSANDEGSELGGVIEDLNGIWARAQAAVEMVAMAYQMYVMEVFEQVGAFLDTHGEEIEQFIGDAWERIQGIINVALPLISGIITGVFLTIRDFIDQHGEDIQNILENAWTIVSNIVMGALEIIEGVLTAALAVFQGDWEGAWTAIQEMSESVTLRIWEVIKSTLDLIANFFGTTLDGIVSTWRDNWNMAVRIVENVGRQMYNAGVAIVENVWDGLQAKYEEVKRWWEEKMQALRDYLPGSEPKDPNSPLRGLSDAGASFITNILDGMRDALPGMLNFASDMGDKLVETIEDATKQISGLIAGAFGGQADLFRSQADNMRQLQELRGELSLFDFATLETSLNRALEESKQFTDPQQAAEYYDLLSRHAFELADIRQQIAETEDHAERERLFDRMRLIQQAQGNEIAAFQERARMQDNPLQGLHEQIQQILLSMEDAGSPAAQALYQQLIQLASFLGAAPAAPASGPQMYGMGTNNNITNNWNMGGIHTNQSPAVIWQSYQMAMAMAQWGP